MGNKIAYKTATIQAKKDLARANHETWDEWYDQLETTEGKKPIYRLAKQRTASRKINDVIRNQDGQIIKEEGRSGKDRENTTMHS